jgi:hypothetical protein
MMTITEPTTFLTDILLAALTAYFAFGVWSVAKTSRRLSQRFWAVAFAAFALAALLGGSWHGFQALLSPTVAEFLWRATTGMIGLAGMLLLIGALYATVDDPWRSRLIFLVIGKFFLYLVFVNLYDSYAIVIADYAPSLLAVLVLSLLRLKSAAFAVWGVAGVLFAVVAALAQLSEISLHEYFNYNDLYHAIQAVSFWLLYRAGLLFGVKTDVVPDSSV